MAGANVNRVAGVVDNEHEHDLVWRPLTLTLSQREGAPLNWRPSADAVAGNGRPLSWAPSAHAVAGGGNRSSANGNGIHRDANATPQQQRAQYKEKLIGLVLRQV